MPASVFLWICPPWDKFCLGQSLLNFLDLNQCIHQFVKFLHILSSSISIRAFSFPFLLDIQLSVHCRGSSCPQFLTFLCYLIFFSVFSCLLLMELWVEKSSFQPSPVWCSENPMSSSFQVFCSLHHYWCVALPPMVCPWLHRDLVPPSPTKPLPSHHTCN